jgi:hypothetical protein
MRSFRICVLHQISSEWSRHGEMINSYNILVGNFEGKRPLGRPRHKWEENIKMRS